MPAEAPDHPDWVGGVPESAAATVRAADAS
jgi:hypothetical protein